MPIRLSGMSSGLDTEALVSALVMGYRTKKDDLVKAQTKLSWKQEKWKSINTSICSFYKGKLNSLKFTTGYNLKKATINNSSYATVKASSNAVTGTQALKVKKLASTGYLTGGKLSAADSSAKLSGSSKLSEVAGMSNAQGSLSITVNGKTSGIELSDDMTINQFVSKLKGAGLNASFDETNQRFFVSSKSSGADNDFSLTASNSGGAAALKALGLQATTLDTLSKDMEQYTAIAGRPRDAYITETAQKNYEAAVNGYNSSIKSLKETNASLEEKNKKLGYKKTYIDNFISKAGYTADSLGVLQPQSLADARSYIDGIVSDLKAKKETADGLTDDEKLQLAAAEEVLSVVGNDALVLSRTPVKDDDGNPTGEYTSDVDAMLNSVTKSISENETKIKENVATVNGYYEKVGVAKIADDADSTAITEIAQSYTDAEAAGSTLVSGYKTAAGTEYDYAKDMTAAYQKVKDYQASDAHTADETAAYNEALTKLGVSTATDATSAVRIAGSNSQIELNGAIFENTTNNFSINGLTIQATALTGDEAVTITTETDVDAIYDSIKDLFSEYNELIKTLDKAYNADSSKGYEPLTDDEKSEMSDDEIEKWETKIKDSLLRRDSTLDGVINSLKSAMLSTFTINGKNYALSSFGISTGGYFTSGANEKGVYHIDGDEDDSLVADSTDKLRAAIANDPDTVVSFFSQLAGKVYNALNEKMGTSTSMKSIFTVYNDKEMAIQYSEYKSKISTQEQKISTWEEYYYKKFSRMESALALLNSQSSSISGLFG